MSIDPTISIHRLDREARRALAGVFETTPRCLFVYLGGTPQDYDDGTEVMMEWHLRALGYERHEYRPLCWTPVRVSWIRKQRWPEDDFGSKATSSPFWTISTASATEGDDRGRT